MQWPYSRWKPNPQKPRTNVTLGEEGCAAGKPGKASASNENRDTGMKAASIKATFFDIGKLL
jgi:hypothetical protein